MAVVVVEVVNGKQYKGGREGGGGKTMEMWRWWWRENNRNLALVVVVEGIGVKKFCILFMRSRQ